MSSIGSHLARRAIDVTQDHFRSAPALQFEGINPQDEPQGQDGVQVEHIAMWGVALIWITVILYTAIMSAISYTYGDVIATLTMIETPTATAFKIDSTDTLEDVDAPLLSEEQKSEKMKLVESDLFLIKQKPITAKIRTAIKHLKAQGGRFARFRGLHVSLIYHLLHSVIVFFFTSGDDHHPLLRPIVTVITSIALCRFNMTWTHIVISAPSTKRWWRRFPLVKAGKSVIIPTAIFEIAVQAAIYVPRVLFASVQDSLRNPSAYGENPATVQKFALAEMILIGLIAIGSWVLIVIPAEVSLKRVQASMLPEEDESIVPFDRTFAGKVKPEILGGSGAVGMLDAWKTFDRSARIRLLKLYLKIIGVQLATTIMFVMVVIGELRLIIGDDLAKLKEIRGHRISSGL